MFPKVVRLATVAATVVLALAAGMRGAAAQAQAQGAQTQSAQSEMTAPDVLVKNVTLEVVDIIQKDKEIQGGGANAKKKVISLIETKVLPHFNFQAMTASAVGRSWDKASAEQKARLAEEFKTLLVRTYSSALSAYSSQKFDFRPLRAKPTDTDVTINVRVMQPGAQPVTIDYDMEKRPNGWKVWDVRVGGISLVANYRTEFDNLVREKGVDGLVKALQAKNNSLEQPAVAGAQKK
jgi:phospholipid transport system substrate-binding protein